MWAQPGDDIVVLVHGLFATAGVLRPLREHIETECGAHTASFTHPPGPGIRSLAEQLRELVLGLPPDTRIYLVGHSIGGIVVRWFVQELAGDPRVVYSISIASPFSGTRHARFFPAPIGRDIVPNSALLERLAEGARSGLGVPHLSIWADCDRVVPSGAYLAAGDRYEVRGSGHNGVLYRLDVARAIVERIRLVQAAAAVRDARAI
jgi:pimeloyl-ACP methyl ester carboxylesterase